MMPRLILFVLSLAIVAGQTKERDLQFKKDPADAAQSPAAVTIPRSYALVVGISRYKNLPEKGQLKFAERDANGVFTTLISPEGGRFQADKVHRLIGDQATLANIRKELETWLPSVSGDQDRVLVYFAGHGFVSGGRAYLAPYDVDPQSIPDSSYSMDRLGEVFGAKIKAKWRVLLTDACHSGAILPASDSQTVNTSLLNLNRSVFSMTASRDREVSFEGTPWGGGHGVFTYYVMKGIEGEADSSGDGVVTADELAEYVHNNVRKDTSARQNPTSERGSFDPNMVLAYNPSRAKVKLPEQSKFGRFVVETNMDGVELFVDGKSQGVINKGKPLTLPGIIPGPHSIHGVRLGYEPDGPRDEMIYPGQDTTVTIRILVVRRRKQAASEAFDKGVAFYNAGGKTNYTKAAEQFTRALDVEPAYSGAAMLLGSTYNALFDEGKADLWFRKAVAIDPDFTEAIARYGGSLLDRGDFDGAIRELNTVAQREPDRALAHYMLAVAFTRKEAYEEAVREARLAVKLTPGNGEAHFWLAESLRMSGKCGDAGSEYQQYLKLSDFDSKLAGKLNYYVLGYLIGMGKKKRAAQHDIWMDLRNQANFGLCDCARIGKSLDDATRYCQAALSYDGQDPFAHYDLGVIFAERYNKEGSVGLLAAARNHFTSVIAYNPDTDEAQKAKRYILNIDSVLARQ